MNKTRAILFFFIAVIGQYVNAQDCKQKDDKNGYKVNIADGSKKSICYNVTRDSISNGYEITNYRTNYTVSINGILIYTLKFNVSIPNDSISVLLIDEMTVEPEKLGFKYSKDNFPTMFNYRGPDDPLNSYDNSIAIDKNYRMLFTVISTKMPFIYLNRFQSQNEASAEYQLYDVKQVYIDQQNGTSELYLEDARKKENIKNRASQNMRNDITQIKHLMLKYQDDTLKEITKVRAIKENGDAYSMASESLKNSFKQMIDTIISDPKIENPSFTNSNFTIGILFFFKSNGHLDKDMTISQLDIKGTGDQDWLRNSFLIKRVLGQVEQKRVELQTEAITDPDIINNFNNFCDKKIMAFKLQYSDILPDPKTVTDWFTDTMNLVTAELNNYQEVKINLPTQYFYSFTYSSDITKVKWNVKKGSDIITDITPGKNKEVIADDIKEKFIKTINKPDNSKVNKYNLEVLHIYINNKLTLSDLREVDE